MQSSTSHEVDKSTILFLMPTSISELMPLKKKKRVTEATLICVYIGLAYRLILFDVAAFAGFAAGLAAINSSAGDTPSAVSVTTVMKPGP